MRFEIIDERGHVRDYAESAVVPWRPEKLQAGPKLAVDGRYFDYRDGSLSAAGVLSGGSELAGPPAIRLHLAQSQRAAGGRDALKMAAAGMRIVRAALI